MLELVSINCPDLVAAANTWADSLPKFLRRSSWSIGDHPARSLLISQVLNDFNDLLFDCLSGRGGSALRSARSLFEDLLNVIAIKTDDDLADRYIAHWPVAVEQSMAWDPLVKYLRGKQLKAARHHTHKVLRENRAQVAEAVGEYGAGFRRSWHPVSIADRAVAAGLAREYEFYRVASSSLHGAAGGFGTFWLDEGEYMSRVGPSMLSCPTALAAGVDFLRRTFDEVAPDQPNWAGPARTALDDIAAQLNDFAEYTMGVEDMLVRRDPRVPAVFRDSRRGRKEPQRRGPSSP